MLGSLRQAHVESRQGAKDSTVLAPLPVTSNVVSQEPAKATVKGSCVVIVKSCLRWSRSDRAKAGTSPSKLAIAIPTTGPAFPLPAQFSSRYDTRDCNWITVESTVALALR